MKISRRSLIAGTVGVTGVGVAAHLLKPVSGIDVTSDVTFKVNGAFRTVDSRRE